jgi:predicted O-methyltransferase YrrM
MRSGEVDFGYCPPKWVQSRELLPGDVSYLLAKAKALPRGGTLVEIGSLMGLSSIVLVNGLLASQNRDAHLFCVDTWKGSPQHQELAVVREGRLHATFLANIQRAGVSDLITPISVDSVEAAGKFADQSIDLIFVDGDHSFEGCYADLAAWFPRVKATGVILGHDCIPSSGVHRAVERFARERSLTYSISEPPTTHYMFEFSLQPGG